MCSGCKACIDTCKMNAIYIKDMLDSLNAVIDTEKCINCKQCYKVCPNKRVKHLMLNGKTKRVRLKNYQRAFDIVYKALQKNAI